MSFPRYPEYKDSGVEWLGVVPGHWSLTKLGAISSLKGRLGWQGLKADEYRDEGPYVVSSAHFDNRQIQWSECPRVSQERYNTDSNIQLAVNDVLLMKDGAAMGKLAFVGFLPGEACLNSHLLLFRPISVEGIRSYDPKFLFYFMQTGYFQEHIKVNGTGATFLGISQDAIGRYRIALPHLPEQTQIAAFLDRETAKIDTLVAEQRRLMALLKEKRQAVISHAVTRGLNPHAPMKSSGIEWLGDVPEHWETRTIAKGSTKITNGFVGPTRDILVESGTPYIQATHIKNGCVNFDDGYFVRPDWSASHSKSILCEGDVLIVQTGAGTGDVGLVSHNEVGYNCHALIIVAPDRSLLHGTYLSLVLQSTYGQEKLTSIETGAMHPHLNCGEVKFVEIPLPPLAEQLNIVSYINKSADQFDTLTTEAQRAIDLLQERRTALISAAVTGQIDVRAKA